MSHDDQGEAGASGRSVPVSSFVPKRQAHARSPEASGKGFHIGAIRPRLGDGRTEVIAEPTAASPPEPFAGEDYFCQDSLYSLEIWPLWDPSPPTFGKRTKATINRT